MSEEMKTRKPYESPLLTDFGTIEDITKGSVAINLDDFPIGARIINPRTSGPIPFPSL